MEKVLITGATGMLGSYIAAEFDDMAPLTLGRSRENDFKCDLRKETPDFGSIRFDLVIHCAGTEKDAGASELNHEGTSRLLDALKGKEPSCFVFISSHKVYSPDAGENVDEESNLWAGSEAGQSKARAESLLTGWALQNDVALTIVRPARMFGNKVGGETLRLFNDALRGSYVHIRGNDARVSLVTAYDVARGLRKVYPFGGIYNVADGRNPKFIEMVEAMTANAGAKKRMTHLPLAWAEWIWRLGRWIPSIDRHLNPSVVENRMKTFTLDGTRFAEKTGIKYFDTIEVMEHRSDGYPYSPVNPESNKNIHEV